MMKGQRGGPWLLCGLGFTYLLSSCFLIFVYETYFRGLMVETFAKHETFNGGNVRLQRRTEMLSVAPFDWSQENVTTRLHVCQLHNKTVRLPEAPNLIIAGAMKSGTTYLWQLLRMHPDFIASKKFEAHFFDWKFALSPSQVKQPSFWSRFNATTEEEYLCAARKEYIEDTFKVSHLMRSTETRLSYEKTPNYQFLPQIPELIHKILPWRPKIILILRDPVDRAYSHFFMDSSKDATDSSFEEYIQLELETLREEGLTNVPVIPVSKWGSFNATQSHLFDIPQPHLTQEDADHANWMVYRKRHMRNYLHRGIYSVQLERWLQYFPLGESLMVINNDELLREPRKVMGEVLEFVAAPRKDYYQDENVRITFDVDKVKKKQKRSLVNSMSSLLSVGGYDPMNNATRHFLEMFFRPYNAELERLLGEKWKGVWSYN